MLAAPLIGQGLKIGEGLPAPLAGISPAGLLQITEGLLAQAAVVPPGPQLQQLVQGIGQVADLQCGHGQPLLNKLMQVTCHLQSDHIRKSSLPAGLAQMLAASQAARSAGPWKSSRASARASN